MDICINVDINVKKYLYIYHVIITYNLGKKSKSSNGILVVHVNNLKIFLQNFSLLQSR